MRIAYTYDQLIKCGGVRVAFEHCRELQRRGHYAAIYCRHVDDATKDWVQKYQIPVREFAELKDAGIDRLISCWWRQMDELPSTPRRFHLVQGRDKLSYADGHAWQSDVEKAMHRTDFDYIAVSDWAGDSCRMPKIVPNGVDAKYFHPATFAKLVDIVRILIEGSTMDEYKGIAESIEVIKRIKKANPNKRIEGWLITRNPGSYPGVIDRYINDPNDITISGAYQNATIMLKATWFDGFGLPHIEAMASGLPLVTTNAGGNMEFCRHDQNCLVAPVGNVDDLTRHVQSLIDSKALAQRLAQNGILTARKWSWERSVDRLLEAIK